MKKLEQFGYLLTPLALGLTAFFLITGGYILIPTNIAWLGGGFDPTQHYIGWAFYRFGPWTMPLGLNPNFGMEFSNSIVFSDSIPIFAIFFKTLGSLSFLNAPFQYLGLWTCMCLVLQAYIAWFLVGIFTTDFYQKLFGAVIILFSPPMMSRIGLHSALVAHFLILAALYLHFSSASRFRVFQWLFIIVVASLTHFYLLAMTLFLWCADIVDRGLRQKNFSIDRIMIEVLAMLAVLYFFMWQAGYFSIQVGSAVAGGYGFFRMNLLSLFDSRGWSYLLKAIPMPMDFGDGFNYLGLGGLLILVFALYALLNNRTSLSSIIKSHYALLVLCIGLSLFAITNNIGLGNKSFVIPLPDWMIALASNLRGSGRMFWPVYYCLQLTAIYVVTKSYSKKQILWILSIAAVFQVLDTSSGWLNIRSGLMRSTGPEIQSPLKSQFWNDAATQYKKVIRVPAKNIANQWEVFAEYAAKNHQATNFTFLSRVDNQKLSESNQILLSAVANGAFDKEALYIFENWKLNPIDIHFDSSSDLLGYVDGYVFMAPGWRYKNGEKIYSEVKILKSIAPEVTLGEVIDFSNKGPGREKFLLDGWGYSENWGTWSDGSSASIRLPVPSGVKSNYIQIELRAFVAEEHPIQNIEVLVNGFVAHSAQLTSFEGNQLRIPLRAQDQKSKFITIEMKMKNPAVAMQFGGAPGDARLLGVGLKSLVYR